MTASTNALFKDIGIVHTLLFDHGPPVRKDIRYFIREFETKRGNSTQTTLATLKANTTEITSTTLPECFAMSQFLPQVSEELEAVTQLVQNVVVHGIESEKKLTEQLSQRAEQVHEAVTQLQEKQHEKFEAIDLECQQSLEKYSRQLNGD
eukprot:m.57064 g.57064  ORF g.57064 m.57064 type:complete len:150 (-) comp18836_c0_seq1:59-508(-)